MILIVLTLTASQLVSNVAVTGESNTIQSHDKVFKRADGLMHELVNLLVDEKFHRKTNEMITGMVKQNERILKQFATFSEKIERFERKGFLNTTEMKEIVSEMQTLKKTFAKGIKRLDLQDNRISKLQTAVSDGKIEQNKTKQIINKMKTNIKDLNDTNLILEINKTTTLLSKQLKTEVNANKYHLKQLKTEVNTNKNIIIQLKLKVNANQYKIKQLANAINIRNGAVYIRWGRTRCPSRDTKLIYSGYAAGAHYKHQAGTDTQCLPKNPTWRRFHDGSNSAARIYGAEYRTDYSNGEALHKDFLLYDVPCAVCQSKKRLNVHMIPARDRCNNGWHLEYRGYLMTQHSDQGASNYACMDANPEKKGSNVNREGRLFYPVESVCGSLPCPPYVNNRELTCAVCTF